MQTYVAKEIHAFTMQSYCSKVFGLNDKQTNIICDPAKYKIIQGIRQSGKTKMLEIAALVEVLSEPNKTVAIDRKSVV
jgi:predicted AAA+ superfamily ATPase